MKNKSIIPFLESFLFINDLLCCVFHHNKIIYIKEQNNQTSFIKLYNYILNKDKSFIWLSNLLLFYKLHDSYDNIIILGPALSYKISEKSIVNALLSNNTFLTKPEAQIIANICIHKKIVQFDYFQNCVNTLSLAINDEPISLTNTLLTPLDTVIDPNSSVIENIETKWSNYNSHYVDKLEYYVRNGLVDDMKELFKNEDHAPYGEMAFDDLRHYKNSMMVHIYIVHNAAYEGGLERDICIRLAQSYSQQCEAAKTIEELGAISYKLRLDFTNRVHQIKKISCNNLTITKAMHYIHDNRLEKLDANNIASAINISSSYLCSEFKKNTGISIVDYIHKEKIEVAKKLLLFSKYSLSEIAAYLSFSSQSYFQSIFKKREGITPTEFRNKSH